MARSATSVRSSATRSLALAEALRPALLAAGYDLVDCHLSRNGHLLQLFVDRPARRAEGDGRILREPVGEPFRSPITLDDCSACSQVASETLRGSGAPELPADFSLEVSSPGIERLLTTADDFARFVGHRVTVKLGRAAAARAERRSFVATLGEPIEGSVQLLFAHSTEGASAEGEPKAVPLTDIDSIRLVADWPEFSQA